MVLGFQRVEMLVPVLTDYKERIMEFPCMGDKVKLEGEIMIGNAPINCKMLNKLVAKHSIASLY